MVYLPLIVIYVLASVRTTDAKYGSLLPSRNDLVLILDSSAAVGDQQVFASSRKFAHGVVREFSVSPSTTRVSLILCSSKPYLQFGLDKFVNKECTLKAIKNASPSSDQHCDLGLSLKQAYRLILRSRKQRSAIHRPRPIVLIINASPHYKQTAKIAQTLRGSRVEIFLITVGIPVLDAKIRALISHPVNQHHLHVTHVNQLDNYAEIVQNQGLKRTCHGKATAFDECDRRCQCSNSQMVNCHRVRKDFQSMSLAERRRYIKVLKTASTAKPYKRIYDEITSYHPRWFDDVHKVEYFFPWHRWYILKFENFLRQIDCRVIVPYWDWIQAVSDKRLWRTKHYFDIWYPGPHGLGGNGEGPDQCVPNGPFGAGHWIPSLQFNMTCLTREFNGCWENRLPKVADRDKLLQLPVEDFENFEGNVREWLHDNFHMAIGGIMSLDASSNAPEFWFHHAFLDKIWTDWQKRGYEFKHQYYHNVKTSLPGAKVNGKMFTDQSKQPACVKVDYAEHPKPFEFPEDKFNHKIKHPTLVQTCDDDDDIDDNVTK
ncbi:Tyrosinase [Exaiptasia diaphana]|nr:Tyrosinase [Exaiptasia diaphana]